MGSFVAVGAFALLGVFVGGLVMVMARPTPEQPVASPTLPRHALRERGGGLPLQDLLRRRDIRRPRRSRRLRRQYADAPTETLRRIEDTVDRLRRINASSLDPDPTVPLPVVPGDSWENS
ncbi:hypothetical protein LX15_001061 [Streptoalloteichus tenebrarius]|uniref:Secreted protein n=1 Tax=Streptoalloteichus tenebrarius (strain ATCC 17920 / DSM 40477 / JCM 4838 / CBS 697.72 / NBRC 16177 / NCIMB 11028 / NRRL B-12390 / A12253. 1 / ISP 5477) TaxID=1933 RepID=A0ABT1HPD2_STRSD|nr:hypothetical protein [Streptoalloteichus tenebrarius]MCP2257376.1 hypothetical protein [Streptoalloteichus tenebrarius]BFF04291.1 hypothetical protein GCM10020241_59660 [Streptoalloteichus tenebrarius]